MEASLKLFPPFLIILSLEDLPGVPLKIIGRVSIHNTHIVNTVTPLLIEVPYYKATLLPWVLHLYVCHFLFGVPTP